MMHAIWKLSALITLISTGYFQEVESSHLDGTVKIFIAGDGSSNSTKKILTYFNEATDGRYEVVHMMDSNICSKSSIRFAAKIAKPTQILVLINELSEKACNLPVGQGIILQFVKVGDTFEADKVSQGTRMPTARFYEDESKNDDHLETYLNDVSASLQSVVPKLRQRRESPVGKEAKKKEKKAKNSDKMAIKKWALLVCVVVIIIGFIIIAILFYLDHTISMRRIQTLKKSVSAEAAKGTVKLEELIEKAKEKIKDKDGKDAEKKSKERDHKGEGEAGMQKKGSKERDKGGSGEKDGKKSAELSPGPVGLSTKPSNEYVSDFLTVINFCVDYGMEDPTKNNYPIRAPGSSAIDKNSADPDEKPNTVSQMIDELETTVLPMFQQFPKMRAHSFYPGVQSQKDIFVEFVCNLLASRGLITDGSPGMLELEMITTSWVGKAFGLPSKFLRDKTTGGGGLQLSTTTEGMFTAILAARQKTLHKIMAVSGDDKKKEQPYANEEDFLLKNMVAYGCSEAHLSFDFGCRLAKVDDKLISPDVDDTMNVDELEDEINKDVEKKKTPVFINATFGSAHSCSFDKLERIVKIAKKHDIWVHVDASYAGSYLVCPSYRSRIKGIEGVNSICVNLHKCITQSSHTTFFWTSDLKSVKDSFLLSQNMLKMLHSDGSYHELATSASNRYKPLKTYLWLRLSGLEGLRAHIETIAKMSVRMRKHLTDDGRLEDKSPAADFGFIIFACKGDKEDSANDRTYRFCCHIIKSNKMNVVLVSPRSNNVIRFIINREHLTETEIDESWKVLKGLMDEWEAVEAKGMKASRSECEKLICDGMGSIIAPPSSSTVPPPPGTGNDKNVADMATTTGTTTAMLPVQSSDPATDQNANPIDGAEPKNPDAEKSDSSKRKPPAKGDGAGLKDGTPGPESGNVAGKEGKEENEAASMTNDDADSGDSDGSGDDDDDENEEGDEKEDKKKGPAKEKSAKSAGSSKKKEKSAKSAGSSKKKNEKSAKSLGSSKKKKEKSAKLLGSSKKKEKSGKPENLPPPKMEEKPPLILPSELEPTSPIYKTIRLMPSPPKKFASKGNDGFLKK